MNIKVGCAPELDKLVIKNFLNYLFDAIIYIMAVEQFQYGLFHSRYMW